MHNFENQLWKLSKYSWLFGGDFNSITSFLQAEWAPPDPLDTSAPLIPTLVLNPTVNSHGRRFLGALSNNGFIEKQQISDLSVDSEFTRLPQRLQYYIGVIDMLALRQLTSINFCWTKANLIRRPIIQRTGPWIYKGIRRMMLITNW